MAESASSPNETTVVLRFPTTKEESEKLGEKRRTEEV